LAELALDDDRRHPLAGQLDGVRVAQSVGREAAPDADPDGGPSQLRPRGGAVSEPGTRRGLGVVAETDAVALFCERARVYDPDFDLGDGNADAVVEICRRVDGLPLAVEVAAARCGLMSPKELADRLETALGAPGVGARDAPARRRTLGSTVDWSYELLTDDERRRFARFALFAGDATIEAAATITAGGLDTLDGLASKSLLVRRRRALAPTRLGMLETIRAYVRRAPAPRG
jgi:predicted ATPase